MCLVILVNYEFALWASHGINIIYQEQSPSILRTRGKSNRIHQLFVMLVTSLSNFNAPSKVLFLIAHKHIHTVVVAVVAPLLPLRCIFMANHLQVCHSSRAFRNKQSHSFAILLHV